MDHRQLSEILMPDLQDMANRPELLEQHRDRRFNRDEPPFYRSPSPEDDDEQSNEEEAAALDEIKDLIHQPLSEAELRQTQRHFEASHAAYRPGPRYEAEARADQRSLLHDRGMTQELRDWFGEGRAGQARQVVYSRHRVKKRWQKLGVWNPEWGIPGRVNERPRDIPTEWKWKWQGDVPAGGTKFSNPDVYEPDHPNSRAIHRREGLHRGERETLPPRHNLAPDASQREAESFITSRPWYIGQLDDEEERTRLSRIPPSRQALFDMDHEEHVARRWEEDEINKRPEVKKAWYRWKWNHESPSPDPEDLDKIELTPSEVDAIEAITPPTPKPTRPLVLPGSVGKLFPISAQGASSRQSAGPGKSIPGPISEAAAAFEEASSSDVEMSDPEAAMEVSKPEASFGVNKEGDAVAQPVPTESRRVRSKPTVNPVASAAGSGAATIAPSAPKRGRGRPPKAAQPEASKPQGVVKRRGRPPKAVSSVTPSAQGIPKKRGRPPKAVAPESSAPPAVPKKRGRPPKAALPEAPEKGVAAKPRGRPPKTAAPAISPSDDVPKKSGRPAKTELSEPSTSQGIAKKRGRPPKAAPFEAQKQENTPKRRGRPPKAASSEAPEQKSAPPKKRGRPPKVAVSSEPLKPSESVEPPVLAKKRGRPAKADEPEPSIVPVQGTPKKRGRPSTTVQPVGSKPQGVVKRRGRSRKTT